MKHPGTQTYETERLICRRFEKGDCGDMMKNWAADPLVQHEYGEPVYDSLDKVRVLPDKYIAAYENNDFYRWAIIEKESNENIGQIAFCRVYSEINTAGIECCIGRRYRGRGYAEEALEGLIGYIFAETGFDNPEAYHRKENVSSGRVLEKSLMRKTFQWNDLCVRAKRHGTRSVTVSKRRILFVSDFLIVL